MTYSVILADPPWSYGCWSGKPSRTADSHYSTMTTDEICAMRPQIDDWAAPDCALFLWVTAPLLPDGMRVMDAWGFDYRTFGLVWVKTGVKPVITYDQTVALSWDRAAEKIRRLPAVIDTDGNISTTHIGMGHYTRANAEIALLGIRGGMKPARRDVSQLIIAPVREHSRKPDEQYQKIEAMYPDVPRLELFARRRVPGWDAWGDGVTNNDKHTEAA